MSSRRQTALFLVLLALGCERASYYGYRSFMFMALRDMGQAFGSFSTMSALITIVGTLVAGGLAFVIGPRVIAVGALALSTLALMGIALLGGSTSLFIIAAFANGLLRPCTYAYAAEAISREGDEAGFYAPSPRRFAATACFASIALVAINVGAFFGPLIAGQMSSRFGYRLVAGLAMLGMLAAGALFGGSILADPMRPPPSDANPANTAYRTAPATAGPPGAATSNAPLIALALAIPLAVSSFTSVFVNDRETLAGMSYSVIMLGQTADVFVTIVAAACAAGLFLALTSKRSSTSLALFIGIGFIVAGLAPMFAFPGIGALAMLGHAVDALGEPLTFLVFVYAALSVRGPARTLVTGGAMIVQTLGSMVASPLSNAASPVVMLVLGALAMLVSGVVVLVFARPIQRIFSADSAATSQA
jgi:dipeptide/tripeptide permease